MLFRNQALKYMNEAINDGAAGGGGVPGVVPTAEPTTPAPIGPGAGKAAEEAAAKAAADAKAAEEAAKVGEAAKKAAEAAKDKNPGENTPAPGGSIESYIEQFAESKPALSLALGFLKDAGITTADPAFQLAEGSNDFTLLEAILAQKGLPGTDQMLGILKAEAKANADQLAAEQAATDELVKGILGEDTEAILDWASQNASADEAAAIDDMLNRGGVYARAVAIMLSNAYGAANVTVPSRATPPTKAVTPASASGEVSASQFAAESQKLYAKYGPDFKQTQEYAKLSSARAQSRAKGL
ncbi:capsid assembly protein [Aeromonas phage ST21]|uniref:Capsid assembly protein n=1 Tax=Aeromonas phage ST21 TaxID=3065691 RepID=A0AA96EVG0_9CAUD|nr:capsid assembly protein [Aeromonas phage ST21]